MLSMFLPRVTEEQQQTLKEQDVPFERTTIDETSGIRIPSDHLDWACRALDLSFRKVLPPRCEDTGWVKYWPKGEEEPVPTAGWGMRYELRHNVVPIAEIAKEILVPSFGMDVCISHPHYFVRPVDRGTLNVHLGCRPVERHRVSRFVSPPKTIWGIPTNDLTFRNNIAEYSWEGAIDLLDEETGFCVARLIGHNLYIRFLDLQNEERFLALFRKTCEALIVHMSGDVSEEVRYRLNRDLFVALFSGQDLVEEVREDLKQSDRTIRKTMVRIEQCSRELRSLDQDLNRLSDASYVSEMILEELAQIYEHPSVIGVRVLKAELYVYTDTLFCVHERTEVVYEIGRFLIILPLNGKTDAYSIEWVNLSRIVMGHHAPHIHALSGPCLGDAELPLDQAMGERSYLEAVTLAILFCQSANVEDSYGKKLTYFPLADTD